MSGPVGAVPSSIVGGFISNQMKPGQAAKAIQDNALTPSDV
ncbi:hypothetical protein [uncultured Roseobacter sp.]|nr:hypothetical protein [uncultured Roseobacter sp.]